MSFVLEDLKSYRLAQQLRGTASRCPAEAEGLLQAAVWLEDEANDMLQLCGSVSHARVKGKMTIGCVVNV